jgi:Raf kinase inhibitor-like YbhB/YbcL family protein
MGLAESAAFTVGKALRGWRAGELKLASRKLGLRAPGAITVTSPAFAHREMLPLSATADGDGVPPPIAWQGVPSFARALVLVCEDPDVPFPKPFVHWLVYGISASADGSLATASHLEGKNSMMTRGFTPAAPPHGHGRHRYHFQLFALDRQLELAAGAGRSALLEAMRGHVVAWGELIGAYERR